RTPPATPTATQPTPTPGSPTPTPTPACGSNINYVITQSTGAAIVPGTTLVAGSQCYGCISFINMPFSYSLYGVSRSGINAYSGGDIAFYCCNSNDSNVCLPTGFANYPSLQDGIFAHWD